MPDPQTTSTNRPSDDNLKPYEYRGSKFYEYAYPEHVFVKGNLDISECKDLYDAGYGANIIHGLINEARHSLAQKEKPAETEIIITDYLYENNILAALDGFIIDNHQQKTWVILSVLNLNGHAHVFMIHIVKSGANINVTLMLHDPYGKNYQFESKSQEIYFVISNQLRKICADLNVNLNFKQQNIVEDLQGYRYDQSNCGALSIFILQEYIESALLSRTPDGYILNLAFDSLPNEILNNALHNAFVLRLKIFQLWSISSLVSPTTLAFQSAEHSNDYIDEERAQKAMQTVESLSGKVYLSSCYKYKKFLSIENQALLDSLINRPAMALQLLNRITYLIIKQEVNVIMNSSDFYSFINNIITVFFNPPTQDLIKEANTTLRFLRGVVEKFTLFPVPNKVKSDDVFEKLSCVALAADNYDEFKSLLNLARELKGYSEKITDILRCLLSKIIASNSRIEHCVQLSNESTVSMSLVIVNDLLLEGADIYAKSIHARIFDSNGLRLVTSNSAIEDFAQLPLSFNERLIEHFPCAIKKLFFCSVTYCNIDLINALLTTNLSLDFLKEVIPFIGKALPKKEPIKISFPGLPQMRDTRYMQNRRSRGDLMKETSDLINQQISQQENQPAFVDNTIYTSSVHLDLINSIKSDNFEKVKVLLWYSERVRNINIQDERGFTALTYLLSKKNVLFANYLLVKGARLDIVLSDGFTPMHFALQSDDANFLNNIFKKHKISDLLEADLIKELLIFTQQYKFFNSFNWLKEQLGETCSVSANNMQI